MNGAPVWISYWADGAPHGHMVLLSDGLVPEAEIYGDMEGCAIELAEAFERCREGRHGGRGYQHSHGEIEMAFRAGMEQLQRVDFKATWEGLERDIVEYRMWGGPPPAIVFSFHPDKPRQETVMLRDKNGKPVWYEIKQKVLRDIMPEPEEGKNALLHPTGLGWVHKPSPQQQRLRRLLTRRRN